MQVPTTSDRRDDRSRISTPPPAPTPSNAPPLDHGALLVAAHFLACAVGDTRRLPSASPEDLIERVFETLATATTLVFDAQTTALRFARSTQQAILDCDVAARRGAR